MLNYSTSPPASLVAAQGPGPGPAPLTPKDHLDIRDALSAFVGRGYTNIKDPDANNLFAALQSKLGYPAATQLLLHMSQFNQRPDVLNASPEQRIQQFYDMGSRDPGVNAIIGKAKGVAQSVLGGYTDTPLVTGRDLKTDQSYKGRLAAPGSVENIKKAAASIQ